MGRGIRTTRLPIVRAAPRLNPSARILALSGWELILVIGVLGFDLGHGPSAVAMAFRDFFADESPEQRFRVYRLLFRLRLATATDEEVRQFEERGFDLERGDGASARRVRTVIGILEALGARPDIAYAAWELGVSAVTKRVHRKWRISSHRP